MTKADVLTVASRTLESLAWALGVARERVVYVPNGVGYRELHGGRLPTARPVDDPVLLLYTRFVGFDFSRVLEALRRVREEVPQARLLVVGEGLAGEGKQFVGRARELGLDHAVQWEQWDPEALYGHLARAALAVYPLDDTLINRAKSPAKLLDLLAWGVPVVAESVGEAREFLRDGETGLLVRPGDVAALSAAAVDVLRDTAARVRMGRAAALDVRERFAWDRLAERVERAYRLSREGR
jgi:glycosyltransferase involved in cell wall biosynthesis